MASNCDDVISNFHSSRDALDFLNVNFNMKMLKPLDEVLRCRICFDYFNNCMITKCSHNYCSVCIRRYMLYKAQCPTCFQEASEPELRNNRLLDEILRIYIKIKETIENTAQSEHDLQEEKYKPNDPIQIKKEIQASDECGQDKTENRAQKDETDSDKVSCPVCYQTVLQNRINIHLDTCLKLEERERTSERRSLPKLVYHLLSEKEIKKKLKEHGLSVGGDRQTLIRRHKNFIVLYNANCDSLNPKPVSDLVKEIEELELEEQLNSCPRQRQVNKRSDLSAIEKEHESHVRQHQSQFSALIQDVQQREINRIVVKQEKQDESTVSFDSILIKQEICEDSTDNSECYKSTLSHQSKKAISQSKSREEKSEPASEEKVEKDIVLLCSENKKESDSSFSFKDAMEFSKSMEKIQDSLTNDSPSSIDDFEIGKMQLSLLRKRKKGRISLDKKQCSPKRK